MRGFLAAALVAALAAGGAVMAQEKAATATAGAKVGDPAPDFRLNDDRGRAVRLSDFRGKKWVVLAFFPKAMTPG